MDTHYIIKKTEEGLFFDDLFMLENPESLKLMEHKIRMDILKLLSDKAMYPAQIAKELKLHEQKVYYHIKQLLNAGVLELKEKKEIRGTTAKKFSTVMMNFAVSLSTNWKPIKELLGSAKDQQLGDFTSPFIKDGKLDAKIVVGSPDPHGPFKARARDGHYAVDLAVFLGSLCTLPKQFSVKLDVDVDLKNEKSNFIFVGGPVTNLLMAKINDFLPAKFSESKPWGIVSKSTYSDDNVGIIAKIPNPYHPEYSIMVLAGVRYSGTKSAVIALTRFTKLVLNRFSGQKEFFCIVQGFDLDGDGSIDSVEVME